MRSRHPVVLMVWLLFGFAATAARAVDGVIEIDQAKAQAGAINGSLVDDPERFPVRITQPGSYRLTGNLVVPDASTSAIEVAVAGVTLDLNGFAIQGPTICSGVPVSSCSPAGTGVGVDGGAEVTVRNGRITGVGSDAIRLLYSARVEEVSAFSNGGSGIRVGNESIVARNLVTSNGDFGVFAASNVVVGGNTVTGNRIDGIRATSGTVSGNTSARNGGYGGSLGGLTSFADNAFEANAAGSVLGGRATSGNVCDDGACSARPRRRYYLTSAPVNGTLPDASTTCAAGFHFAALWEILEPGSLDYDRNLGQANADSGSGPPSAVFGWVRTGETLDNVATAGQGNCDNWSTTSGSGSVMLLDPLWKDGNPLLTTDVPPWIVETSTCNAPNPAWCVQD